MARHKQPEKTLHLSSKRRSRRKAQLKGCSRGRKKCLDEDTQENSEVSAVRSLFEEHGIEKIIATAAIENIQPLQNRNAECAEDLLEAALCEDLGQGYECKSQRNQINIESVEDFQEEVHGQYTLNEDENLNDYNVYEDNHIDTYQIQEKRLEGRCIVDLAYFLDQLHKKFDNHQPALNCPFSNLKVVNSRYYGLKLQIFFQCQLCHFKDCVWTDTNDNAHMDVNRSAVLGSMAIGIGHSQMEEFLASMNVHSMASKTYRKYDLEMVEATEKAAKEEMYASAEMSKRLAIERGDFVIHNGEQIPFITVVADCSWMKRSYRTGKYDSLSGVGAILDNFTGKAIFIGVRNKFCAVCEWAMRHDVLCKEYKCFKNWGRNQPSTAMESDIIVEGFKTSIAMHNLIYKTLIADGDSRVHKSILDSHPYKEYNIVVDKKECVNHLYRNLARKLREIGKTKERNISQQKQLVGNSVLKFRKSIEKGVAYHQESSAENTNSSSLIELLKKDVLNTPYHVFGDHTNCQDLNGYCKGAAQDEVNVVDSIKKAGLFQLVEDAIKYLSYHANSLFYHATNNVAEAFNSIVCKLIGGKRVNFGMRTSYQGRCAATTIQHNTLNMLSKIHESEKKIPPIRTTTLERKRKHKIRNNAEIRLRQKGMRDYLPKTKVRKQGYDKNYGPNAEKPDAPDYVYEDLLLLHQDRLLVNQKNRDQIETDTSGQDKSSLWHSIRKSILTASHFGRVIKMLSTTSCSSAVQSILYPSIRNTPALIWGRTNEAIALKTLEKKLAEDGIIISIRPCGLFIDASLEYLGASPDGVIDDHGIVEVKCPKSAEDYNPTDAIQQKTTAIYKYYDKNDSSKMNTSHVYYYQVQGQLHITQRDYCYFAVWTPHGLKYVKVLRDDDFWKHQMEPNLSRFYKTCLLPEIIDSRYNRSMPIREPVHILEARRLRDEALESTKELQRVRRLIKDTTKVSNKAPEGNQQHSSVLAAENLLQVSENIINIVPKAKLRIISNVNADELRVKLIKERWTIPKNPLDDKKVSPLKLRKTDSENESSWVISSADEQKAPILKLKRVTSKRGIFWSVSSSDDQTNNKRRLKNVSEISLPKTIRPMLPAENSWVVISDNECPNKPSEYESSILQTINKNVQISDIRKDILSAYSLLNDSSIDKFLQIVKDKTNFETVTTLLLAYPRFITSSHTSQDVQIIGGNSNRHWRCVYYDGSKMYIYDSLGCYSYDELKIEEQRFISLRYPRLKQHDITFPHVQKQPDNYSCGIFAAAFATTVILGCDPSREIYSNDVMKMRNHLMTIIETQEVSAFPHD